MGNVAIVEICLNLGSSLGLNLGESEGRSLCYINTLDNCHEGSDGEVLHFFVLFFVIMFNFLTS